MPLQITVNNIQKIVKKCYNKGNKERIMEKTIDTNNIYEVINAINAVVRSSKNPKPIGNSKYEKAQEITDKMKYAWSSYI